MITCREYEEKDHEGVCELIKELGYDCTKEEIIERMNLVKQNPDNKTIVAEMNAFVVGMIGVSTYYAYEYAGKITHIQILIVKQELRNQGIGKKLFECAKKYAVENYSSMIYLTSGIKEERKRAHDFYRYHGMEITGYRFVKKIDSLR